jgi:hypothetical protein
MRISEKKVAQLIERPGYHDTLVIVDEGTGEEIELTPMELWNVVQAAEGLGFIARGVMPPE